jgi:apolipoprotein N-acyltransferase
VALAPLLVALGGTSGWRSARLGYVTGAVSSIGLLYWTALVVIQYGGLALPVGILVMVALCLAFSVFHALFGWAAARLVAAFGPAGLLGAPLLWTGLEYARTHTFFSFPWTLLGYSQQAALPFAQVASITAVYGVSFLVCSVSALLAYATVVPRQAARRAAIAAVALLVGGAWGWGSWQMAQPVAETGRITVGLVQGGVRQEDKWVPEYASANVERHLQLTARVADAGARLVVWPESAVPFLFDQDEALAALLRDAVRRRGIYLFFGNDDLEPLSSGERRIYVGAKLLDPSGELVARYHKMHLVPFGEYVPLQRLFTLGGRFAAKLVQEVSDFTPGTEATIGVVDGHRVGGFICYEAIFPSLVRRFAAGGGSCWST